MSLWDYKIFDLIVNEGNLRKTAALMHLTPAAVSHSLAKLEKEFGLTLIVRGHGTVKLTKYGQALLPHIRMTLAADNRLHAELDRIKGNMNGLVRIGAINSVCCSWLPAILQRMRQEMPDISAQIFQGGYDQLEDSLLEGSLDLAFVSLPTRKRLTSISLLHDRLLCITPVDFVPENKTYITIEEIKGFDLIIPGPNSDFDAIKFMETNGIDARTVHSVSEDSSIIALVESGLGVSIMPELVLQKNSGDINVYPVESAPYRDIGIATAPNTSQTAPVSTTLKIIIEYVTGRYPTEQPYFRQ